MHRPQSSSSSTTTTTASTTAASASATAPSATTTSSTTATSSSSSTFDEEIYFQTEMYCEAIDGIYQERKNQSISTAAAAATTTGSSACHITTSSVSGSKKAKEKLAIDYFKNLTTLEICNLIYLIDLKCFSSLQSVYALFLSKSNTIGNLSAQMSSSLGCTIDMAGSSSLAQQQLPPFRQLDRSNLSEFTADVVGNILGYNRNFVESVRLLPDLSIVLKKHKLKENRNNSSG